VVRQARDDPTGARRCCRWGWDGAGSDPRDRAEWTGSPRGRRRLGRSPLLPHSASGCRGGDDPESVAALGPLPSPLTDLRNVFLYGASLSGANLVGTSLRRAGLQDADLTGAKLTDADLMSINLVGAKLRGADLRGADLRTLGDETIRTGDGSTPLVAYSSSDLSEADLKMAHLDGGPIWKWRTCTERTSKEPVWKRLSWRRPHCRMPPCGTQIWRGADLQGADLSGADLRRARLNGARLENANLDHAKLNGAIADANTEWPQGFDPVVAGVVIE
jgi:uncharacterized protein YjbI with pentapeptide repeats